MTPPPSKVAALRSKDLLGIGELEPDEISLILDTAESMRSIGQREIKKVPALRGRMVANLFFEPSTRTRFSFEPSHAVGVNREMGRQKFERNLPLQSDVFRQIDLAHAA